jgi:hypothetical protein
MRPPAGRIVALAKSEEYSMQTEPNPINWTGTCKKVGRKTAF